MCIIASQPFSFLLLLFQCQSQRITKLFRFCKGFFWFFLPKFFGLFCRFLFFVHPSNYSLAEYHFTKNFAYYQCISFQCFEFTMQTHLSQSCAIYAISVFRFVFIIISLFFLLERVIPIMCVFKVSLSSQITCW